MSISRLDDAVSRDIYSGHGGAHAQTIDANTGNDAATQVANLLLIASLSTAVNPVKGLRATEALACLVTPNADLDFFRNAIESLRKSCWYLHKPPEDRIYFDKVENLKKMLEGLAERAPEPKVEQRLIRIKRFGQARDSVDMLNLVYHQTRDEDVYAMLSARMKDKFDIFGGLPDCIDDNWIDDLQAFDKLAETHLHMHGQTTNIFEERWGVTVEPGANRWDECARVLSRRDIEKKMGVAW